MSTYRVGDLASLISPSSNKLQNNIQSLFDEHWNKRQKSSVVKNPKKNKAELKNSDLKPDSPSSITKKKKNKKRTKNALTLNSPLKNFTKDVETDFNSDFLPIHNKKKPKRKFSEVSSAENENIEHSKNVEAFIRCVKNKRQKTSEIQHSTESTGSDNLFNETTDNENILSKRQSKKKKNKKAFKELHQIPSNVDYEQEMDSFTKSNKEKSKMDPEEIKALNLKDLPFTLFIGNLPVSANRKTLSKLFSPFGQIKTVRLRGAVSTKLSIPKKVAEIKGEYHEGLHSRTGFVVFTDENSAKKALSLNGTLVDDHHIVVDFASEAGKRKLYSNDLSIFIGNLPFDIDDETVRSAFQECGEIHAIRIIRDRNTGLGKGFGYIQFKKTKSKEKALTLEDIEINGRKIRIKPVESDRGMKAGRNKAVMSIRNNMAFKRTKWGNKKSVKKLLKKGKQVHKKKQIARLLGEKFVK